MDTDEKRGYRPERPSTKRSIYKKEVYQHPQPADWDVPLRPKDPKQVEPTAANSKEEEKTSKEEGLNQQVSGGDAGAFEGFEDAASNEY